MHSTTNQDVVTARELSRSQSIRLLEIIKARKRLNTSRQLRARQGIKSLALSPCFNFYISLTYNAHLCSFSLSLLEHMYSYTLAYIVQRRCPCFSTHSTDNHTFIQSKRRLLRVHTSRTESSNTRARELSATDRRLG